MSTICRHGLVNGMAGYAENGRNASVRRSPELTLTFLFTVPGIALKRAVKACLT